MPTRALLAFLIVAPTLAALGDPTTPGVLAQYFSSTTLPNGFEPGLPLPAPDYSEILDGYAIDVGATVGASPFSDDVSVRLVGTLPIPFAETYSFFTEGGESQTLTIDGSVVDTPLFLDVGTYPIEVRFSLVDADDLPLWVAASIEGILPVALIGGIFAHETADELPVIHAMPTEGSGNGGTSIVVEGFGFGPTGDVEIRWGNAVLANGDFASQTDDTLAFVTPSHAPGTITVRVATPQGTSNAVSYEYTATGTPPEPEFTLSREAAALDQPIAGTWAHDGRFYVGLRNGEIAAIEFDENSVPVSTTVYTGVADEQHVEILGVATSPWDTSGEVILYVSHTTLFAYGGGMVFEPAPYIGRISIVRGPDFDVVEPFITGLPTSNHDHGPNALHFDNNGDLLIASGGTTNAGIQDATMGAISESPLSGAMLKARTSDPTFVGDVKYMLPETGEPTDNQIVGFKAQLAPGAFVTPYASGLRNTFDFVLATNGYVYATDNGPNIGLGPTLTSETTFGTEVAAPDEVLLVEAENYYGHPNISRGAFDPSQFVYRDTVEPSIPHGFTQALAIVDSSTNGIVEYRSEAFWGQWRNHLIVQRFNGLLTRLVPSPDGRHIDDLQPVFPPAGGLNIRTGPGGAIHAIAYSGGVVRTLIPNDEDVTGVVAYDIHPWRAPRGGGAPFTIGGKNFTSLEDTQVLFGDTPAVVTSVNSRRIEGIVPSLPGYGTDLVGITVTCGAETSRIDAAFRALFPIGTEPGRWLPTTEMPVALSDVAAAEIDGTIYVVGAGHPATLTYSPYDDTWSLDTAAPRPFVQRGQSATTLDGKLYVIGSLGAAGAGKVQIYDPELDIWTLGSDMPWPGGSVAATALGDRIYVAGGTLAGLTTDRCASYHPATDTWTAHASMPFGRHFAAVGSLADRMWVFGGWSTLPGGQFTSDHTDIQVYDPTTDQWLHSGASPALEAMPLGRGGTGRAVYWQGEFYIFGGALTTDTLSVVLDLVDVYDPSTLTWRQEATLPTGRHGISPVLFEGRTFLFGGSAQFGVKPTALAETFTRQ